jgi:exodeoxyribonuclease III
VPNAGENLKRLDYRVDQWDVEFQSYLNNLKKNKNIILCGDLNVAHKEIDIYSVKGHEKSAGFTKEERESFNNFLESGYIDTFRYLYPKEVKFSYFSARRVTNKAENKGWRLDYFVINVESRENLVDSNILNEYSGSDHTPIKLVYKA